MEKANQNNIKVLLDGQGADEVVAGYPRFVRTYLNEMIFKLKLYEIIKYWDSLKEKGYSIRKVLGINRHLINFNKNKPAIPIKSDI